MGIFASSADCKPSSRYCRIVIGKLLKELPDQHRQALDELDSYLTSKQPKGSTVHRLIGSWPAKMRSNPYVWIEAMTRYRLPSSFFEQGFRTSFEALSKKWTLDENSAAQLFSTLRMATVSGAISPATAYQWGRLTIENLELVLNPGLRSHIENFLKDLSLNPTLSEAQRMQLSKLLVKKLEQLSKRNDWSESDAFFVKQLVESLGPVYSLNEVASLVRVISKSRQKVVVEATVDQLYESLNGVWIQEPRTIMMLLGAVSERMNRISNLGDDSTSPLARKLLNLQGRLISNRKFIVHQMMNGVKNRRIPADHRESYLEGLVQFASVDPEFAAGEIIPFLIQEIQFGRSNFPFPIWNSMIQKALDLFELSEASMRQGYEDLQDFKNKKVDEKGFSPGVEASQEIEKLIEASIAKHEEIMMLFENASYFPMIAEIFRRRLDAIDAIDRAEIDESEKAQLYVQLDQYFSDDRTDHKDSDESIGLKDSDVAKVLKAALKVKVNLAATVRQKKTGGSRKNTVLSTGTYDFNLPLEVAAAIRSKDDGDFEMFRWKKLLANIVLMHGSALSQSPDTLDQMLGDAFMDVVSATRTPPN